MNEEGEALAGVEIYYGFSPQFSDSDHGGTARTDSEGRFELDSLPAAPPIRFRKGGYSEIREETLPLDGEEEVVITMRSPGVLRGRVADAQTRRPVKSFTVRVTFSPDCQPGDPSGGLSGARAFGGETFSTEDGTFRMGDFIRGMPSQVTVKADGYDPAVVRRVVAVPEEKVEEVEFRLKPVDQSTLLTIAGRLVNEQGAALPGAEMRLIVATKRPFPSDALPFNWTMIRSGQVEDQDLVLQFMVTVTDPQGPPGTAVGGGVEGVDDRDNDAGHRAREDRSKSLPECEQYHAQRKRRVLRGERVGQERLLRDSQRA